jgi:hypothetical protein
VEESVPEVEAPATWLTETAALIAAAISKVSGPHLFEYATPLRPIVMRLESEGSDARISRGLRAVHDVLEFRSNPGQDPPYTRWFDFPDSRSLGLEDLTDEDAQSLEAALPCSGQALYQSRLADVLWLVTKDSRFRFAQAAVGHYLRLISETPLTDWTSISGAVDRVAAIACSLGAKSAERAQVKEGLVELFQDAITHTQVRDLLHWPAVTARTLLRHFPKEEFKKVAEGCLAFAQDADREGRGTYLRIASDALRTGGDEAGSRAALHALGDHWIEEAERSHQEADGLAREAEYRKSAIETYREAGESLLAEQQIPKLQEVYKSFIGTMTESPVEIDLSELLQEVEARMAGATGQGLLRAFVRLNAPTSYNYARDTLEALGKQGFVHKLFPTVHLTPEGNVAKVTPGQADPQSGPSLADTLEFYRTAQGVAGVMLERARQLIHHSLDRSWESALREVLRRSEFVPESRRDLFERAILAGFRGDGVLLCHLIIPQLENSLRAALGKVEGKTTTVKDGIMRERDLNDLLRDDAAASILGEDIRWEARALLTEQPEPNLRNRVCHGLIEQGNCEGPIAAILLWLTLVLVVRFMPSGEYA